MAPWSAKPFRQLFMSYCQYRFQGRFIFNYHMHGFYYQNKKDIEVPVVMQNLNVMMKM